VKVFWVRQEGGKFSEFGKQKKGVSSPIYDKTGKGCQGGGRQQQKGKEGGVLSLKNKVGI